MWSLRYVFLLSTALAVLLQSALARAAGDADEKAQCISASERGQELRDEGAYIRAGEAFARCSRDSCPALVKRDCVAWQLDLEARAPTVVFGATDSRGADLEDVKVSVDGAQLVARLDGQPTRVDPGPHVFQYQAAGYPPVETRVVIRAGEKNRALSVQFRAGEAVPGSADAGRTEESAATARAQEGAAPATQRPPVTAWILSGVALAAVATGTYFGVAGLSQRNGDLSPNGCAPRCSSSEVGSIRTKFAISDVSIGVGLVAAGAAAYVFLRPQPSADPPRAGLAFGLQPGGGLAAVRGSF